jgi:hypothetical protein
MSLSSTDKGLLTPSNCAVIFIDHQLKTLFGVANIVRHPKVVQGIPTPEGNTSMTANQFESETIPITEGNSGIGLATPRHLASVVQHTEFCRTENRNDRHLALSEISRTKGENLIGRNAHQST